MTKCRTDESFRFFSFASCRTHNGSVQEHSEQRAGPQAPARANYHTSTCDRTCTNPQVTQHKKFARGLEAPTFNARNKFGPHLLQSSWRSHHDVGAVALQQIPLVLYRESSEKVSHLDVRKVNREPFKLVANLQRTAHCHMPDFPVCLHIQICHSKLEAELKCNGPYLICKLSGMTNYNSSHFSINGLQLL